MPGENDNVNDVNETKVCNRPIILCCILKYIPSSTRGQLILFSIRSVETFYVTFAGGGRSAAAIYILMMLTQML